MLQQERQPALNVEYIKVLRVHRPLTWWRALWFPRSCSAGLVFRYVVDLTRHPFRYPVTLAVSGLTFPHTHTDYASVSVDSLVIEPLFPRVSCGYVSDQMATPDYLSARQSYCQIGLCRCSVSVTMCAAILVAVIQDNRALKVLFT